MSIKSDRWIRRMAQEHDMINPYSEKQVSQGVISYGVSSYGYDLRVSDEFKIFTNVNSTIVDPKNFDERSFVTVNADVAIIPPNSFALARSVEYFKIPRDVLTVCVGKSTYARCGIIVNVTPFEPEWEGFVTLEISNTTPLPAKIYANEGLCQILFFQSDEVCETSYKDRKGKYQSQKGRSREDLQAVSEVFDLRPAAIARDLDLRRPIYKKTAAYGQFGRAEKDFTLGRPRRGSTTCGLRSASDHLRSERLSGAVTTPQRCVPRAHRRRRVPEAVRLRRSRRLGTDEITIGTRVTSCCTVAVSAGGWSMTT